MFGLGYVPGYVSGYVSRYVSRYVLAMFRRYMTLDERDAAGVCFGLCIEVCGMYRGMYQGMYGEVSNMRPCMNS